MLIDSNKIAFISGSDKEITYHTLLQKIYLFSLALEVQKDDRVLILSEPRVGYVYALFAIWQKGASYSQWFYNTEPELWIWAINDIKPQVIFCSHRMYPQLKEVLKKISFDIKILLIDELEKIPTSTETPTAKLQLLDRSAVAFRVYTAGITDKHKPIELSLTNIMYVASKLINEGFYNQQDKVLVLLPFYNNWILISTILVPLIIGATCVFSPKDEIYAIINTVSKHNVSILILVRRIYNELFNVIFSEKKLIRKDNIKYKLATKMKNIMLSKFLFKKLHTFLGKNIRYFLTVGAKLEKEIYETLITFGFDILEGYGMAEASSLITIPTSKRTHPESVGRILEGVNYKLINDELVLNGYNIGKRYYNRKDLNSTEFNNNWFFTKDIVEIDEDGFVKLIGRTNDNILLNSGRTIIPAEIDKLLDENTEYILESGTYFDDKTLNVVIIPTANIIEKYGKKDNYSAIRDVISQKIIEPYNHSVQFHKRINKIIISEQRFSRSTSGKIKRYLLVDYEKQRL